MLVIKKLSREEWLDRYDKPNSKKTGVSAFKAYDKFLARDYQGVNESELYTQIRTSEENQRYHFLDALVQYWKTFLQRGSIVPYFNFVKMWLAYNDIEIKNSKVKMFVKFPKQLRHRKIPITNEQIQKLLENSNPKYKRFWEFQASSGCRPHESTNLVCGDVDWSTSPPVVLIPAKWTKAGVERRTMMNHVAERMLRDAGKDKAPKGEPLLDVTYYSYSTYMQDLRVRAGLTEKGPNGRYLVNTYKFRKYCETTISNYVETEFAHAITGHAGYMDTYHETPDDQLIELYKKGINRLTLDNTKRLKDENENLKLQSTKVSELERKNQENEDRIKRMEMILYGKLKSKN